MTRRPKVDLRVPTDEWDAFENYVKDEHGKIKGYVGREVERAMREWIDVDEFAAIEDRINQLIRATGRSCCNQLHKKRASDTIESEDTTRVSCRVDSRVKDNFSQFVNEMSNDRLGVALARALRERRTGGRSERVENKLDRIIDEAKDLLAELDDSSELTIRQKRTIVICSQLGDEFTEDELEEVIGNRFGDTKSTLRNYKKLVLKRRDAVKHPDKSGLYISREQARQWGVDLESHPIEWKPYRALTDAERIEGVQIKLAQLAKSNGGKYRIDSKFINDKIFNSKTSYRKSNKLLNKAADSDGFEAVHHSGKNRLKVDLTQINEPYIWNAITSNTETATSQSTNSHSNGGETVLKSLNDE